MMERQLRQLVHLVNDLLDVSRITTGKMTLKTERAQLSSIIDSALETAGPLIRSRHHLLVVDVPTTPVTLSVDVTRMAQVFVNLLNNTTKFTAQNGRVTFSARVEGSELIVEISDTGLVISAKMLPLIFEMFAQADRSLEREHAGLGVGLSLARYLTELHGGTIEAIADAFAPDFAFLDIGLPPINGYEVAKRLRASQITRDSVLVAVTGWGQEDDKRRAREAGFDHHMVKPVEPDQILEVLATFKRPS